MKRLNIKVSEINNMSVQQFEEILNKLDYKIVVGRVIPSFENFGYVKVNGHVVNQLLKILARFNKEYLLNKKYFIAIKANYGGTVETYYVKREIEQFYSMLKNEKRRKFLLEKLNRYLKKLETLELEKELCKLRKEEFEKEDEEMELIEKLELIQNEIDNVFLNEVKNK